MSSACCASKRSSMVKQNLNWSCNETGLTVWLRPSAVAHIGGTKKGRRSENGSTTVYLLLMMLRLQNEKKMDLRPYFSEYITSNHVFSKDLPHSVSTFQSVVEGFDEPIHVTEALDMEAVEEGLLMVAFAK